MQALATNPRDAGLSVISVTGYSPLGQEYNNPQESTSDTFQLARHGDLDARRRISSSSAASGTACGRRAYRDVQARGFLTFVNQGYTGNALADLLLGPARADRRRAAGQPAEPARASTWSAFAQDDWRLRSDS